MKEPRVNETKVDEPVAILGSVSSTGIQSITAAKYSINQNVIHHLECYSELKSNLLLMFFLSYLSVNGFYFKDYDKCQRAHTP